MTNRTVKKPKQVPVRPPRQARSRDTLERIVTTTASLLDATSLADVKVLDITRRARSSVGAFYGRFADKDALLDHLDEGGLQVVRRTAGELMTSPKWRDVPLAAIVPEMVRFLVRHHRERRGVLRAVLARARSRGRRSKHPLEPVDARYGGLIEVILKRRAEIDHPSPDQAAFLGFVMVLSAIRERILFPESMTSRLPIPDEMLTRELAAAYLAYLRPATAA